MTSTEPGGIRPKTRDAASPRALRNYGLIMAGAIGLIAECGQHFSARSADMAWQVALRFLQVTGSIDAVDARRLGLAPKPLGPIDRYEIVQPVIATSDHLRLTGSYAGFDVFKAGAVAAFDGEVPVVAPFDDAIVLAPRPDPVAGQQAFAWGRRLAA